MSAPGRGAAAAADRGFARLLRCLELEPDGEDCWRSTESPGSRHLFGGLVGAQSAVAAGRSTPPGRALHSLHAYFLRPGRGDRALRFEVERIRDGGSFSTRCVRARQDGEEIFFASASFCAAETGIAHQDPMPAAPPPDGLFDRDEVRARIVGQRSANRGVEVRMCDSHPFGGTEPTEAVQRNWLRLRGRLPDDPLLAPAMLVYLSDTAFMSTINRRHPMPWGERRAASLDHAIWIHHTSPLDDWVLFVSRSPVAEAARGLVLGELYDRDGRRLASVAQEALVRRRRPPDSAERTRS